MKLVGINERGYRVGEDNQSAVLSNHEVDLVFELREDGMTYAQIALKMECSITLIAKIIRGELRTQIPARYKWVLERIT